MVLDSQLRTPPQAKLFKEGGAVLVITAEGGASTDKAQALLEAGAELATVAMDGQGLDLTAVLTLLSERGCNELMVEAGATVSGAFLQAKLVDEWFVYMAPTLMGSAGRPLMGWPMQAMAERQDVQIVDIRAVGQDWRIHCRPAI